jgi:hypothetical protein
VTIPSLTVARFDNAIQRLERKERVMFTELSEELLDLQATVRGFGGALYAVEEDPGSSSNCSCCNLCCCCSCCDLCW